MRTVQVCLLLFAWLVTFSVAGKNFYQILGVSRDADDKEIKAAYRQLSKKYHPDKNSGDDTAQAKFIEIGGAYEVLIDAEKRRIYDQYGEEGLQNGGRGGPGGGGPFADMFQQFFNGGGQPGRKPKAQPMAVGVGATLKDYFNGKQSLTSIRITDICDHCKGTGSNDGKLHTCGQCEGRGRIRQTRQMGIGMIQQFDTACPHCQGSGQQIKNRCKKCHGQTVVEVDKEFHIQLNPGTKAGQREILVGEGARMPNVEAGDIHIVFQEDPSGNLGYRRVGNNLYRSEVLSLKEALNGGWSREIDFFDEYHPKLTLAREEGDVIFDGYVQTIHSKGMPLPDDPDEYGDLFIEYRVIYPIGLGKNKLHEFIHDEL